MHEHEDLPTHLLWAAQMHARRVLDLGTPEKTEEIFDQAVSIGVSIELLVKSTLAGISYHLLAAETDHTTTLTLSGITTSPTLNPVLKTVGAEAALNRLNAVTPKGFGIAKDGYLSLLAIRNSAVHMGSASAKANQDALLRLVTVTEWIFRARATLNQSADTDGYWGPDRTELIEKYKNQARTEAQRELDRLLHRARRIYQEVLERVDGRTDIIAQFASTPPLAGESEELRAEVCPACENQAWVVDQVHRGIPQNEINDDGTPLPSYVDRWCKAQYLRCGVCQLVIRDAALLDLAGIRTEIELEPDEATQQEIENYEDHLIESYIDERYDERYDE